MKTDPDALSLAPIAPSLPDRSFIARHAFPILLLGLLFSAFSPIFVRLSEIEPISTAFNRMVLPLPLFFVLLWLRPQDRIATATPNGRRDLWMVVLSGVFFAGDLTLWNSSVMLTSVTNAAVLANITPIFIVAGAWLLFKDRPRPVFILGMMVALAGSFVMMRESLAAADGAAGSLRGDLLAVGAAAFYAGYVLTLSQARQRVSITAIMALGGAASVVILLVLALLTETQLWPSTREGWTVAIAMSLFAQLAGQMLIAISLAHVSAGLVATMFLAQPIIPGFTAWLLFDEGVTGTQIIGAAALLAGLEISRRASAKSA